MGDERNEFGTESGGQREGGGRNMDRGQRHPDPHYNAWRDEQMSALDRDYDDYRQQHANDPSHDFGTWRTARQSQRDALRRVREHMEVVGSDGAHVGRFDKVRGDTLVLAKGDAAAGGSHHTVPSAWIESVGETIVLNRPAQAVRSASGSDTKGGDERSRALGESENQGSEGPHILDRSFAGTYKD